MSERPLGDVLLHAIPDFTPEHPERAPWQRDQLDHVEHAHTGNIIIVPLKVADRVHLRGLDRPSYEQDCLEPSDWTPAGWGVAP
jgi:hypothetical protein